MRIEAFSRGKKHARPEDNEDSFLVIPEVGYAVIDGVTDRNGTRYDGMLSGRFAAQVARDALAGFLAARDYDGPQSVVACVDRALQDAYRRHGRLEQAAADSSIRAGCALLVCIHAGDTIEVVAIGDTGLRVNGRQLHQALKPLDDITSLLRREAWRLFEGQGRPVEECDRLAAQVTWHGLANQPPGETAELAFRETLHAHALAACRERLPTIPVAEIEHLLAHGIIHGQRRFTNTTELALGYGTIDGFGVPPRHVDHLMLPAREIRTLELFSDGYFKPGDGFGVAAWEGAFAEVEAIDPHKIGAYLSTKGSGPAMLTDDRTYLGIEL